MRTSGPTHNGIGCRRRLAALLGVVSVCGWAGGMASAEPPLRMVSDDLVFHAPVRAGRGGKLGHATVTQINNDVRYQPGDAAERRAVVRDVVRGADLVRTGQKSQAELEFEDRTITRLGSNSAFSFDSEKREFNLKKGLLLFDMPKTAGGGKIVTPACTAAIEGTAGMISYRSAPKVLCLAGTINVLDPKGKLLAKVMPGQLFIVGVTKSPVNFMLGGVRSGKLMQGGLPNNTEEFTASSDKQVNQIVSGQLLMTSFTMIGERPEVYVAQPTAPSAAGTQAQEQQRKESGIKLGITTDPVELDHRTTVNYNVNPPVLSGPWGAIAQTTRADGTEVWDFGSHNVIKTESVPAIGGGDRDYRLTKVEVRTTGSFKALNESSHGDGQPWTGTGYRSYYASDIQVDNTIADPDASRAFGPGKLKLISSGNLRVDRVGGGSSSIGLVAGTVNGSDTGGEIRLESAGTTSFTGGSAAKPNQALAGARGVGGTIEIVSMGPGPLSGVFIQNAQIDASHPIDRPYPQPSPASPFHVSDTPATQGGTVKVDGAVLVDVKDTTHINADGQTAGAIRVASAGTASTAGSVNMEVTSPSGYIRLSAQDSAAVFNALTTARNVDVLGATRSAGAETIQITATGPADAGKISLAAMQELTILHAQLNASAAANSSYAGGFIRLQAPVINLQNAALYANGGAGGIAGRIQIGGSSSTLVNILNSMLSTTGYMPGFVPAAGDASGIYISGSSVGLAGTTLVPGPTAIAHIYTDNFTSPPASGAYQVQPLASAPR